MITSRTGRFVALLFVALIPAFLARAQQATEIPSYPKVTGYFSVLHPIGTWNKDGFHNNFSSKTERNFIPENEDIDNK
jgi:hypothetical protein